jgi:hypothetical protein
VAGADGVADTSFEGPLASIAPCALTTKKYLVPFASDGTVAMVLVIALITGLFPSPPATVPT